MQRRGQLRTGNAIRLVQEEEITSVNAKWGISNSTWAIRFNADKTKMLLGSGTSSLLNVVGTNINDWTLDNTGFNGDRAVEFNADGTKVYSGIYQIKQYSLTPAYDLSTFSLEGNYDAPNRIEGMQFSNDGLKIIASIQGDGTLKEYDLTTAYNVTSGVSLANSYTLGFASSGIAFYNGGLNVLVLGSGNIYKYTLAAPYSLTSVTNEGVIFNTEELTNSGGIGVHGLEIDEVNKLLYITDSYGHFWQVSYNKL
jgi:WD40 repeat protein